MKYKNALISILFSALALAGLIWFARADKAGTVKQDPTATVLSALIAPETSYDFGLVSMAKGTVEKIFKIKNTGSSPAVIEKISTSCMCTEASLIKSGREVGPFGMPGHGFIPKINESLAPGEEAEIKVVFDPAAHGPAGVGFIERIVYIEERDRLPLELKIRATVTP